MNKTSKGDMQIDRRFALALAAAAIGALLPSASAAVTCNGKPATVEGTSGADRITGTDGDDVINALGGHDAIETSPGDDVICGGNGIDKILLQGDGGVANLKNGVATAGNGTAKLVDIEDAYGTNGNDELIGDSGSNLLVGQSGNDKIVGLGGKDQLIGQDGNDKFFPGSGEDEVRAQDDFGLDTLSYRSSEGAVALGKTSEGTFVFEYRGQEIKTGLVSADELFGNFAIVEGSPYSDQLTGLAPDNTLRGLGGDDTLIGGDGNDTLNGAPGDDTLVGGPGDDLLNGGANSEVKNIKNPGDLADYRDTPAPDGPIAFEVDLAAGKGYTSEGTDTLIGIESAHGTSNYPSDLYGDDGPNVLIGDRWYDVLEGRGGADYIAGGVDSDILDGGPGSDYLDGEEDQDTLVPGEGDDTVNGGHGCKRSCVPDPDEDLANDDLDYTAAPNAVHVDLSSATAATGGWGTDSLLDIEGAYGSNFDDILTGDDGDNYLVGGKGNDSVNGGAGFDYCEGEARVACEDPARRQRI